MDLVKQANLEDWELSRRRAELSRLEQELAEQEKALETYRAELDAFERRYFQAFAPSYAELTELEAQIAASAADLRPEDAGKRRKAERLRARADGRQEAQPDVPPEPSPPKRDDELKGVYRALSKLIHPDLARDPDERQRRETLMVQANIAYTAGDKALLSYLLEVRAPACEPLGEEFADAWTRLMSQIERTSERLAQTAEKRRGVEDGELARLMRRAQRYEEEGRDLFAKFAGEFEEEKQRLRKRLKTLQRRANKRSCKAGE